MYHQSQKLLNCVGEASLHVCVCVVRVVVVLLIGHTQRTLPDFVVVYVRNHRHKS